MKLLSLFILASLLSLRVNAQNISVEVLTESRLRDHGVKPNGISGIEMISKDVWITLLNKANNPTLINPQTVHNNAEDKVLMMVSDQNPQTKMTRVFGYTQDRLLLGYFDFFDWGIESVRYNSMINQFFYSYEHIPWATGVGYLNGTTPKHITGIPASGGLTSENRGIEGITFGSDQSLWIALESSGDTNNCNETLIPFYRIKYNSISSKYDPVGKLTYSYPFNNCSCIPNGIPKFNGNNGNGVSEILGFKNNPNKMLVLERCFDSTTRKGQIKLYLAIVNDDNYKIIKTLIHNFGNIGNMEGMTWGEDERGYKTIWMINDNNFHVNVDTRLLKIRIKNI